MGNKKVIPNEDKQNRLDFLQILLWQAYSNTHTPKSFEQWQKGLYLQIIKNRKSCAEERKAKNEAAKEDHPQKAEPTKSAAAE